MPYQIWYAEKRRFPWLWRRTGRVCLRGWEVTLATESEAIAVRDALIQWKKFAASEISVVRGGVYEWVLPLRDAIAMTLPIMAAPGRAGKVPAQDGIPR